jgi:hypothetical protein
VFDIDITQNDVVGGNSRICSDSSSCDSIDTNTIRLTRYTNALSVGQIVGIVVGSVAFLLIVVMLIVYFCRIRKAR